MVVDSTDRDRLHMSRDELHRYEMFCATLHHTRYTHHEWQDDGTRLLETCVAPRLCKQTGPTQCFECCTNIGGIALSDLEGPDVAYSGATMQVLWKQ